MLMLCLAMIDGSGAQDSFEKIYNDNKDLMYQYAYSILKDVSSSEDAVQDAFISLAKNFEKTKQMDCNQIRSYLIIIVRHAAFKIYNKRKREISTEDIYTDGDDGSDLAADAESRELRKALFGLVRALDPKYGDVIMLKYFCDMKDKEIAGTLDISLENVKVRLHRAKTMLKKQLKEAGYCD